MWKYDSTRISEMFSTSSFSQSNVDSSDKDFNGTNEWTSHKIAKLNYYQMKIGYHNHIRNLSVSIYVQNLAKLMPNTFVAYSNDETMYDDLNQGKIDIILTSEDDAYIKFNEIFKNYNLKNIQYMFALYPIYYFLLVDYYKIRSINDLQNKVILSDDSEHYSFNLQKLLLPFIENKYNIKMKEVNKSEFQPINNDSLPYAYPDIQITNRYDAILLPSHYPSSKLSQIVRSFNTIPLDMSEFDLSLFLKSFPCYKIESVDLQYLSVADKMNKAFINTLSTNIIALTHNGMRSDLIANFMKSFDLLIPLLASRMPFVPIPMSYEEKSTFWKKALRNTVGIKQHEIVASVVENIALSTKQKNE